MALCVWLLYALPFLTEHTEWYSDHCFLCMSKSEMFLRGAFRFDCSLRLAKPKKCEFSACYLCWCLWFRSSIFNSISRSYYPVDHEFRGPFALNRDFRGCFVDNRNFWGPYALDRKFFGLFALDIANFVVVLFTIDHEFCGPCALDCKFCGWLICVTILQGETP